MDKRKLDDKDLEGITGGTAEEIVNTTTGGSGSGSGSAKGTVPGEPIGGSPGVETEDPAGGIGDSGPGDLNKG